MKEGEIEYGDFNVNPAQDNSPEPEPQPQEEVKEPAAQPKPEAKDNPDSKLEKMLKDSQSMIGKQGKLIGDLKSKLDALNAPKEEPKGPPPDEMINGLLQQMENGEITLQEGLAKALKLNSQLTASQVMQQFQQQKAQEEETGKYSSFLKNNPNFEEIRDSGELTPYLESDPLADDYSAYKEWKKDQEKAALLTEYEAKIAAAKEEGAKLAQGADNAQKVIGKQGQTPQPRPMNRPWTHQDATQRMQEKLAELRK